MNNSPVNKKIAKMKTHPDVLTQLMELSNGAKLYKAIANSCDALGRSLRELCEEADVSSATLWRMRRSKQIANLKPLRKIHKVLVRWADES